MVVFSLRTQVQYFCEECAPERFLFCFVFFLFPFFFNVLDFPAAEKVSCLLRCTTTEFVLIIRLSVKENKAEVCSFKPEFDPMDLLRLLSGLFG